MRGVHHALHHSAFAVDDHRLMQCPMTNSEQPNVSRIQVAPCRYRWSTNPRQASGLGPWA